MRVLDRTASPTIRAGQDDRFVDDHRPLMRDARPIVDPDWNAGVCQHRDVAVATARRRPVRDQLDVAAAFLCARQRFGDTHTRCQTICADKDLAFGIVN